MSENLNVFQNLLDSCIAEIHQLNNIIYATIEDLSDDQAPTINVKTLQQRSETLVNIWTDITEAFNKLADFTGTDIVGCNIELEQAPFELQTVIQCYEPFIKWNFENKDEIPFHLAGHLLEAGKSTLIKLVSSLATFTIYGRVKQYPDMNELIYGSFSVQKEKSQLSHNAKGTVPAYYSSLIRSLQK